jgi:peptidoglycan/LPS O-acetylase OafA/YrhL
LFIAAVAAIGGRRALWVVAFACVAVTATRVWVGARVSIETHLRVDEILAGAIVALLHRAAWAEVLRRRIASVPLVVYFAVLLTCCHSLGGSMHFLRPYVASAMVASTLWRRSYVTDLLSSRTLRYIADISFALYVIHPIMRLSFLNSSNLWQQYLIKRPIGFGVTFLLAHFSTFYYEKWWIKLGKTLTTRSRIPVIPTNTPCESTQLASPAQV